jgi:hypothetical protein
MGRFSARHDFVVVETEGRYDIRQISIRSVMMTFWFGHGESEFLNLLTGLKNKPS